MKLKSVYFKVQIALNKKSFLVLETHPRIFSNTGENWEQQKSGK